jgi:hypothetical protein
MAGSDCLPFSVGSGAISILSSRSEAVMVAVGLSPRILPEGKARHGATIEINQWLTEAFKRRSATPFLILPDRGLKPTATIVWSLCDPQRPKAKSFQPPKGASAVCIFH